MQRLKKTFRWQDLKKYNSSFKFIIDNIIFVIFFDKKKMNNANTITENFKIFFFTTVGCTEMSIKKNVFILIIGKYKLHFFV